MRGRPLKKKKTKGQILSFPLIIRSEANPKIKRTLWYAKKMSNKYLRKFYQRDILEHLSISKVRQSYKILEPESPRKWRSKIPSRVNRGILEISGRILRVVNSRRNLFELMLEKFGDTPDKWSYKKLIAEHKIYVKSQYIQNLSEQAERFYLSNGQYPTDFFQLQTTPKAKAAIISYAPDDGQAILIEKRGNSLFIRLKVLAYEDQECNPEWEWIEFSVPLPSFLSPLEQVAPDLRLDYFHGQLLPVIDYKVEIEGAKEINSPYFLTVDWGIRKLVTICVFDKQGNLICPPFFLSFEPIQAKLLRIRNEIDQLKAKRDKCSTKSDEWKKYNREIAKRWRKFRAIQKQLAHLASNVIVLIAQLYHCSEIYVEWLKTLKSKNFSAKLNWVINTTVREAIYEKVAYKAKLTGIKFKRPLSPYGTSQYCPRCGKKGIHTKSPNHWQEIKSGGWFRCPCCGYNADRDYVACCNLARKVLYGNLNDTDKGIAYMAKPISDSLFRQSKLPRERLFRNLSGWKEVISLQPQKNFSGRPLRL